MTRDKKIVILSNEVEAKLMEEILRERQIPHIIQSYHSIVYDGIFQLNKGWGHVESEDQYKEEIISIYEDIKNAKFDTDFELEEEV
ncbi:hypothetical protein SAMN05660462_02562 [Proteiniborus ethanoligenes]|uniref:Signal transducing protein n=1 Tax=Proteiniborus ethanoligenes TaxID=415015 RepID=A0A1H3RUN4_9FIRM|nr:hypothetical protein [Proteiniborus ethanoligenes]TAH63488.1 MAG: hypothetical protein EWM50_02480 [Gottschalkiaceae bacterium]SDZ29387.1 hypothetical protein SAMN05660462_02562 [Proteiniborus ethanoligenes]